MIKIAASMLAADIMHLSREVHLLEDAGCDLFHVDVMDGIFVPNITYGPMLIAAMKRKTMVPLDVHLMITKPERFIHDFILAGADFITVHYESVSDLSDILTTLREEGVTAGVSVKPVTDVHCLAPYLNEIDMVLIMTVEPGFGGQRFLVETLPKVTTLRDMGYTGLIEADGGINMETLPPLINAGIDIAVMGTALFGANDKFDFIEKVHRL